MMQGIRYAWPVLSEMTIVAFVVAESTPGVRPVVAALPRFRLAPNITLLASLVVPD